MGEILGPRGMATRQDAMVANENSENAKAPLNAVSTQSMESKRPIECGARLAYREKGEEKKKEINANSPRVPGEGPKGGPTPNRLNPRTGQRDPCPGRGREYRLPMRPGHHGGPQGRAELSPAIRQKSVTMGRRGHEHPDTGQV